jgi:hypothetical protein
MQVNALRISSKSKDSSTVQEANNVGSRSAEGSMHSLPSTSPSQKGIHAIGNSSHSLEANAQKILQLEILNRTSIVESSMLKLSKSNGIPNNW